jgi:inosine-uridine nucleoside N-ribohydrolase
MAHKVVLLADPGIDGAFAIALATQDPNLEVLGLAASAGNVGAEQATKNAYTVLEQVDPPRWPRIGAALPVQYGMDGTRLHGPGGLGGVSFPCAQPHHKHPADKLLIDLVRQHPNEVTLVCMSPLTTLARAIDRDPELPALIRRLVCLGGTLNEPGNAGPVSEFHFACDPAAAQQALHCGAPITLIPLDAMRKALFSPTDLLDPSATESRTCAFLRRIVAFGIGATSNLYGIEGFHLKDLLGVIAVSSPGALTTKPMVVDVETRGERTQGMSVFDLRPWTKATANVECVTGVDTAAVRTYIEQGLARTC